MFFRVAKRNARNAMQVRVLLVHLHEYRHTISYRGQFSGRDAGDRREWAKQDRRPVPTKHRAVWSTVEKFFRPPPPTFPYSTTAPLLLLGYRSNFALARTTRHTEQNTRLLALSGGDIWTGRRQKAAQVHLSVAGARREKLTRW